ncbi:hypothetical protein NDU88_007714 [Pleurodeles waltl]|uniref:Uncharacterized protein n=1 Tax=Pleurodeles waltl TaxID=8319 RepID=A0AAV7VUA3_PLEWA|nr:hypothetical protein NDU88_007714 [Pleurodeles waltl]
MGAAPDAWDSDFRDPGTEKRDDGLDGRKEEFPTATDARGEHREPENAAAAAGEGETGKSELPKARARSGERASQQETSTFRHTPGGTWLNMVRSLFQGYSSLTKNQGTGERGARQEGRVAEGGIEGETTTGTHRYRENLPERPTYHPFRSFIFRYTWESTSSQRQSREESIKNTKRETLKKKRARKT